MRVILDAPEYQIEEALEIALSERGPKRPYAEWDENRNGRYYALRRLACGGVSVKADRA